MSIILTPAQALALGRIAEGGQASLQLHQVGDDPDLLITWGGATEPALLLRADGTTEPIAGRAAGRIPPR